MSWWCVSVAIDGDHVERLCDALIEAGAICASVTDADADTPRESALFAGADEAGGSAWQHSLVSAIFDEHSAVADNVTRALCAAGLDPNLQVDIQRMAERDWVAATQNQFTPLQISSRLWVVPTWHTPPVASAINLIIDPGLAFGTGSHPTTRMCLAWLDHHLSLGARVLDYGCGSGILAIAALKLGASSALGVDIDEASLLAAAHNGLQNHVPARFAAPDQAEPAAYDVVVANILANPLKLLAPVLAEATVAGGQVVLSGILEDQAAEVAENYRPWFDLSLTAREENWVLLSGTRQL